MFGPEERQCAVDLCFTTPPATAQVVRRLGYPTRQCLERWLAKGSGYAGRMAKPIIPLKTRNRAIELVLGGIRREQATERLSAGVMAALRPGSGNASQADKPAPRRNRGTGDAGALRRRVEEPELENALMWEVAEAAEKGRAPTCGACRTGRGRWRPAICARRVRPA